MKLIVGLIAMTLLTVAVAAAITLHAFRSLDAPPTQAVSSSVLAVNTGRSYAYIVTGKTGVVLVDAGSDPKARALSDALAQRGQTLADVRAVLVTSPHPFAVAGLSAIGSVPVYVGAEDLGIVARTTQARPILARACDRWMFHGKRPNPLEAVLAGSLLEIDGVSFEAVAVPAVSRGARAYLAEDVAFIGPTLEDEALPSRWFAEQPDDVPRALLRLSPHAFHWLAASTFIRDDGHGALDRVLTRFNRAAFAAAPL